MVNFDVVEIEEFETSQKVCKLVRNGKCSFDFFIESIKKDKNLEPELGDLFAILEDAADNKLLPKTKYRKERLSSKLAYAVYAVKSRNLRLYVIHERDTGKIVLLGGKKTDQSSDLERAEKIVKEYTAFKLKT